MDIDTGQFCINSGQHLVYEHFSRGGMLCLAIKDDGLNIHMFVNSYYSQ